MIRVDLGQEVEPNVWLWTCALLHLRGRSRQPLFDACRDLQRAGADPKAYAGLFRNERHTCDMTCTVQTGARLAANRDG
jgi:hypothetical protein